MSNQTLKQKQALDPLKAILLTGHPKSAQPAKHAKPPPSAHSISNSRQASTIEFVSQAPSFSNLKALTRPTSLKGLHSRNSSQPPPHSVDLGGLISPAGDRILLKKPRGHSPKHLQRVVISARPQSSYLTPNSSKYFETSARLQAVEKPKGAGMTPIEYLQQCKTVEEFMNFLSDKSYKSSFAFVKDLLTANPGLTTRMLLETLEEGKNTIVRQSMWDKCKT
jgi:hypothetical protein